MLTLLLLLTNCKIVVAADYTIAPIIKNVIVENKEVKPGDILKIVIEALDNESGFDESTYCSIDVYNFNEAEKFSDSKIEEPTFL